MMTLSVRGSSLAALALALILATPAAHAAAQEMLTVQMDESAPAPSQDRPMRVESTGGPGRAEIIRSERDQEFRADRSASRFGRTASPQPSPAPAIFGAAPAPMRIDPDVEANSALAQRDRRGERRGGGGFGGNVRAPAEAPQAGQQGAGGQGWRDRAERRGEARGNRGTWRNERADQRVNPWQRGGVGAPVGTPGDAQGQRVDGAEATNQGRWRDGRRDGNWGGGVGDRNRGDNGDRNRDNWRDGQSDESRAERGNWGRDGRQNDWRNGRGDNWRDGRRDGWRNGAGNDWRDGRRDDWRRDRNWRRDDWRWGWNGRPGWDNRDFRRWDRRWRDNRSFDWFDFRRGNNFLFRPGPYFAPFRSHRYNRLSIGLVLDSLFFQPRFFINDPRAFHLPPVYGPYQWVRYYDDVVLVDIYTGEVVDVLHDFFW